MARRRNSADGKPASAVQRLSRRPVVGLFVETSSAAGREILGGIARYARDAAQWILHLDPREQIFDPNWMPLWLDRWRGRGIIARIGSESLAAAISATGLPAVDVLGEFRGDEASEGPVGAGFVAAAPVRKGSPTQVHSMPVVSTDDGAIGRVAAEHLIDRRFHHFAFMGVAGSRSCSRRRQGFQSIVELHGCRCEVLEADPGALGDDTWDRFIDRAAQALRDWPKPLGLMLSGDHLGPQVAQACTIAGVAAPEDIAIVGVGNDEPLCLACNPPLSSVDANYADVGYRAAELLDRLMTGEPGSDAARQAAPILVRPRSVVERASSAVSAVADALVAGALQYIREGACDGIQVAQIANRLGISPSALQRRFRAAIGRSIHEEIVRVQLRRAGELLRDSGLSLRDVAERSGFNHQEYMGSVFKAHMGMTPGEYRRSSRRA